MEAGLPAALCRTAQCLGAANNNPSHRSALVALSHLAPKAAATAPANCARMNGATSAGLMPAKVSERARAMVTAGLAKDVEAVNQ